MLTSKWQVECVITSLGKDLYFVPKASIHRPASKAILSGSHYEPRTHELIRSIYNSISGDLVHAGTFFGDMIPSFSRAIGPKDRIYAFEPVLESYVLAKQCIEHNNISNIILSNCGLSDNIGSLKINTMGGLAGGASSIINAGAQGDQSITTLTVDMFCIDNLACIQLDVEGHELHALKGSRRTIARCSPIILIEDNNNNCKELMEELDYAYRGRIPGLKIWVKRGDERFDDIL